MRIANVTFLAGFFGAASAAAAQTLPSQVTIEAFTYAGSGCPAGSVAANLSADKSAVTLLFDQFVATQEAGSSPAEARRQCQLAVDLNVPNGWQYSVASFDYRGYAGLDAGVRGTVGASYYFQGSADTARWGHQLDGPRSEDYAFRDDVLLTSTVWSPCGERRALNVNAEVTVSGAGGDRRGLMTVDSLDGEVKLQYAVSFRPCGPVTPADYAFQNYAHVPAWSAMNAAASGARSFTGDFNGDGKTDYLFTWTDGNWWVGLSTGQSFDFRLFAQTPQWGGAMAAGTAARFDVGDFNGDGKADVVFTWPDGNWWVGLSDGQRFNFGNWAQQPAWGSALGAGAGARTDVADFNGDGKADYAVALPDGTWWVGLSTGSSFRFTTWASVPAWGDVIRFGSAARSAIGDFNGDGRADYLFTWVDGNVWVGLSTGGRFDFQIFAQMPAWSGVLPAQSEARLLAADFSGDRRTDLLITWPDGNWWVGVSTGARLDFRVWAQTPQWGKFMAASSAMRLLPFGTSADGRSDVLFTWVDGNIWVGESQGNGFSFRTVNTMLPWGPIYDARSAARVHTGNFNGDARRDLMFTWTDGTWWVAQ